MPFLLLLILTARAVSAEPAVPDVGLWQQTLSRHVTEQGLVDYASIKEHPETLNRFRSQLAEVSPDSHPQLFPSREAKLAYWLNAYNALVLHAFTKDYPDKRERLKGKFGQYGFFYRLKHRIGGQERSLDDIESNSIRKGFSDPRIHFAIVCASASCPWLSKQAYTAQNVNSHLEADARKYFSQERNFRLEEKDGVLWLPKILDWFSEDFGKERRQILAFVARYRPSEKNKLLSRDWRIRYFDYDWSPNDVRQPKQ